MVLSSMMIKMKAVLNKFGINLFANFLPKLIAVKDKPIFLVTSNGMLIYGMQKQKTIRYTFDLLPEAFAEEFDLEEEVKFKTSLSELNKMFKYSKKFDKATLEFKGNIVISFESQKGIKTVTNLPAMFIEEEDEFSYIKGYTEINEHEDSFSFKIEAESIKHIFAISKGFSSKQNETILIEKSEDVIRMTTKHDVTISTSVLESNDDSYLMQLDGYNGAVLVPFKPLEIALSCCDLNSNVSIAVIDETLLCVRQLTDNYIFEAVIMGSAIDEV